MSTHSVTIDLVTERPSDGAFVLVLVEEGPWAAADVPAQLHRIQERLNDCVDVAVDGHLAQRYPDSHRKPAVIRLECYDLPDSPVRMLVTRFAESIRDSQEVQRDLLAQGFVKSLDFEYNNQRRPGE